MGDDANAPGPMKRPLSLMSPTLVFKHGKLLMATGSPGGSRIITIVLQIIVNVIDYGPNVAEAENAPRPHDQLFPDELRIERGMSPGAIHLLEAMGHKVGSERRWARQTQFFARRTARSPERRT
jgi:gamma-glutamyltranspeptidase / glutathione hydrolase